MNKNFLYNISQLLLLVGFTLGLSSCRETFEQLFADDEIAAGDEVMFTSALRSRAVTRTITDGYVDYQPVSEAYEFDIKMYSKEGENKEIEVATGKYKVEKAETIVTLNATEPLYWPSNTIAYGFKATAGSIDLETNQSDKTKWLAQDRLEGASPGYFSAKDWKNEIQKSSLKSDEKDYKKIPLYLQHKRALITIKLKAGEGVSSEALNYRLAETNLNACIYSYQKKNETEFKTKKITPLLRGEKLEDQKDTTAVYEAIVEPHDYSVNDGQTDTIAKISLSGQNYSFYANNDNDKANTSYNLTEGMHLIITITLSRYSRKALMSAYIEDWTEDVTTTICDDYGNAGVLTEIKKAEDLKNFLDKENKPGNVALIYNDIELEEDLSTYSLQGSLNLGGHKITSKFRLFKDITSTGSLVNGTVEIDNAVDAAIAYTNDGVIEDVKIVPKKDNNTAKATVAGAVVTNTGIISKCHSFLLVEGDSDADYAGGIAANSSIPNGKTKDKVIIDGCTVSNRVGSNNASAIVGGIVGQAEGIITNNTFEYGITLSQNKDTHKNIVGSVNSENAFISGNAWPTKDENSGIKNYAAKRYSGIIDCVADFAKAAAVADSTYLLVKDIKVENTIGDVEYKLEGNNKQITTSQMIFGKITGSVSNLTVYVDQPLVSTSTDTDTDVMAPLAKEVTGGTVHGVAVTMAQNTYIQAANPAGLVVWATDGAIISNCEVTADIKAVLKNPEAKDYKYAGGIVSTASKATISQCVFHSDSKLATEMAGTVTAMYYGGIVGGVDRNAESSNKLTITDCTNYCSSYIGETEDDYHGGIIGYAIFSGGSSATENCQGNWWPDNKKGTVSKGAAVYSGSIDTVVGKRNAAPPAEKK